MIVLIDPNVVVDVYVDTGRYMYNEISIVEFFYIMGRASLYLLNHVTMIEF